MPNATDIGISNPVPALGAFLIFLGFFGMLTGWGLQRNRARATTANRCVAWRWVWLQGCGYRVYRYRLAPDCLLTLQVGFCWGCKLDVSRRHWPSQPDLWRHVANLRHNLYRSWRLCSRHGKRWNANPYGRCGRLNLNVAALGDRRADCHCPFHRVLHRAECVRCRISL